MDDMKRGDDAADHVPRRKPDNDNDGKDRRQDAPNYKTTDKGQAIEDEDVNSANDE